MSISIGRKRGLVHEKLTGRKDLAHGPSCMLHIIAMLIVREHRDAVLGECVVDVTNFRQRQIGWRFFPMMGKIDSAAGSVKVMMVR